MENAGIRYFSRDTIEPPENCDVGQILSPEESLRVVAEGENSLTEGGRVLLTGLLKYGNIMKFSGGIGVDYSNVFKNLFLPSFVMPGIMEMIAKISDRVDAIIVPDHSGILPGALVATQLDPNMPILRIKKDGKAEEGFLSAKIRSYTGGQEDVLGFWTEQLKVVRTECSIDSDKDINLWLYDDIVDTGQMFLLVNHLIQRARSMGYSVRLVGGGALMLKTYTGARDEIKKLLGFEPEYIVGIEDLGLSPRPWIKVRGVEQVLSFPY